MQVARWGEDLVVRLPADMVKALALKEGDEVKIEVRPELGHEAAPNMTRESALQTFRDLRRPFPADFKFDREEANER